MIDAPFFKCHPNQWLTGRISFESYDIQGAYWKACCYYWSHECNLSVKMLKKILPEQHQYLIDNDYIKINSDKDINIDWLDKQFNLFKKRRLVNSANGRKGGLAKARNSPSIKKREEKKDPTRSLDSVVELINKTKSNEG